MIFWANSELGTPLPRPSHRTDHATSDCLGFTQFGAYAACRGLFPRSSAEEDKRLIEAITRHGTVDAVAQEVGNFSRIQRTAVAPSAQSGTREAVLVV
jgi:hypothetical protein